jgi:hypothetical protein
VYVHLCVYVYLCVYVRPQEEEIHERTVVRSVVQPVLDPRVENLDLRIEDGGIQVGVTLPC